MVVPLCVEWRLRRHRACSGGSKKHVEFESDHNTREGGQQELCPHGTSPSQHLLVWVFPPFPAAKVGAAEPSIVFPTLFYFVTNSKKTFLHNLIFERLGSEFLF
ncbi:hypothetical protein VNO80_25113 [Phaseolus coccineus]|uniref:Uncharacterized protein n=1 Tax=Phaseolus coccineus TaxID=3886 RepID=A0AAN9QLN2_PHACN